MNEIDLERGLHEFLEKARRAFLEDSSYAEEVARQAMTLEAAQRLVREVD